MALSIRYASLAALAVALACPPARSDSEMLRLWGEINQRVRPGASHAAVCADPLRDGLSTTAIGCLALTKDFCERLHEPGNRGNLDLGTSDNRHEIRLGERPNGLSEAFVAYSQAKLAARKKLPADLQVALGDDYFKQLGEYLTSKPLAEKSDDEYIADRKRSGRLSQAWNDALEEVWIRRTIAEMPAYFKKRDADRPPAHAARADQIWRELKASVYRAQWKDHVRWNRTEDQFKLIKEQYIQMIDENKSLDLTTRKAWLERLRGVRLELPGSNPEDQGSDTDECATTTINAFYNRQNNTLTVCAGDFNAEDELFTLGHELGHAIDPGSSVLVHEDKSDVSQLIRKQWDALCDGKPVACPTAWTSEPLEFDKAVAKAGVFPIQGALEQFLGCLQSKKIDKVPDDAFLESKANEIATRVVSDFADWNELLRTVAPDVPTGDGRRHVNPQLLRPYCKLRQEGTSLSSYRRTLVVYTTEFVCADANLDRDARMQLAGSNARGVLHKLAKATIPLGGPFSENSSMVDNGYSQDVGESFADTLGARAVARVLEREPRYRTQQAKRDTYFASIAWSCEEPSLQSVYRAEATTQKGFSLAPHPLPSVRQRRFLTPEIQRALGCVLEKEEGESKTKECTQI